MTLAFEPGRYKAKISKWALGVNGKGNPQLVISFTLLGRYANGGMADCPSYERSIFKVINENTIDYVVSDLTRLGYPHDTFDQLDPSHPQAFNFGGIEVDVKCDHETFEGKTREKWNFNLGGGLEIKALERKEVSKLNALFGTKMKAARPANGAKPAPQAAAATATATAGKTTEEQAEEVF